MAVTRSQTIGSRREKNDSHSSRSRLPTLILSAKNSEGLYTRARAVTRNSSKRRVKHDDSNRVTKDQAVHHACRSSQSHQASALLQSVGDTVIPHFWIKTQRNKATGKKYGTSSYKASWEPPSLFDLPGEMRNIIYGMIFADTAPKEVNLLRSAESRPSVGIIMACRQPRYETYLLYQDANQALWNNHDIYLNCNSGSSEKKRHRQSDRICNKLSQLPQQMTLKRLELRINIPRIIWPTIKSTLITMSVDQGVMGCTAVSQYTRGALPITRQMVDQHMPDFVVDNAGIYWSWLHPQGRPHWVLSPHQYVNDSTLMIAVMEDNDTPAEEVVGFYKLPREMRDRFYYYYFEDTNIDDEIDLTKANQHLPPTDITRVCKGMRQETLQLSKEATARSWQDHRFYVVLDRFATHDQNESRIRACIERLNGTPSLRRLCFHTNENRRASVVVSISPEGGIVWSLPSALENRWRPSWHWKMSANLVRSAKRLSPHTPLMSSSSNSTGNVLHIMHCAAHACRVAVGVVRAEIY
ncbi:uncharacterized protein LTR77_004174 [Saxophila tyrrhenica]|uniref:WW domain-containing protein n=1 Tax=Saxophila tyrrhenica TaxID=1690608 RepID=A0AAV9PCQ9_9PEZI|nr:hypothetical protein LTR77_004174 [Saxophila tyrrhenica]